MAKLFIPLPEDKIGGNEGQKSGLISSKPQAEIEEGADPFLVDVHGPSEAAKADNSALNSTEASAEPASTSAATEPEADKPGDSAGSSSLSGGGQKSELDTLLEANILEEEAHEPSRLSMATAPDKVVKPGDAFWTEVNLNGENRSVFVKVKQVTIVEKMGDKALAATASSAVKSAAESASVKSASGAFPFLKIQLPALSKIFRDSASATASSIAVSSGKPGIFASLFHSESATSSVSKTTTVSKQAAASQSEKPTTSIVHVSAKLPHPSTTSPSVAASNGLSISIKGTNIVLGTKSKSEEAKTASRGILGGAESVVTVSSKQGAKTSTPKSVSINEKVLTRIVRAMTSAISTNTSSKSEAPKGQTMSRSAGKKETSSSVSTSVMVKAKSSEHSSSPSVHSSASVATPASPAHSTASTKSEPASLGDVFDILKNMPGSSKHSTNSTFIQGQFSFPKDSKLEKKVFKLSGYISS